MEHLKENDVRNVIGNFYKQNINSGKKFTVDHFKKMGIAKSTIYDIIKRSENNLPMNRKIGCGRKPFKITPEKRESMIARAEERIGISQRKLALKYKISVSYVNRLLSMHGLKYTKRKNAPKTTEKQEIKQKKNLLKLSKTFFKPSNEFEIIMDDESYFCVNGANCSQNSGYYTKDSSQTDPNIKFNFKKKFDEKVLVWIAISRFGHSSPYFAVKNCALDAKTYSKECITKRLHPFINSKHQNMKILFWPDGARCHYAKHTLETYNTLGINFVDAKDNPPNVPQLRPIENFWAHLKAKVYGNGFTAKNLDHLKNRIRLKLKEFDPDYFFNLMDSVKTKVRKAADLGPLSVIK